ncbi:MAG TPA: O-antigen ligase family protein [Thiolinea sp.]|nr:O-antigen ligase family protein [Thiolinea sp.]
MLRILALLFILSLFIPFEFYTMAGTVRLEAYRIILIAALVYALLNFRQLLAQADLVDILLFALIGLSFASFWYNHSLQKAIESTGLYALETLGAFYLARLYITTPERFFQVNRLFIFLILLLLPLTLYEALSHHRILHELAEQITGNQSLDYRLYTDDYIRGPLMRATSVFAHPILFGTLAALFFPFAIMLFLRQRTSGHFAGLAGLVLSMLTTLSSAPLLSLIFQGVSLLLVRFWNSARRFWVALFFGGLAGAMLLNVLSNRGFFGLLISYLTFNPNTGYFRMLQWKYSMDDILDNPILGIAHNDWSRPYWQEWMGDSIDSFWLLLTLQHGVFATLFLLIACFYAVFNLLNRVHRFHDAIRWMVTAWILAFLSLILIGFSVDYFGKLQPIFFFALGMGGWARYYLDVDMSPEPPAVPQEPSA